MSNNSVGDFIQSVFSSLVNTDDDIFKALFANPNGTGTIEKLFRELEETRNTWCNNSDVYNQSGEMLEKTMLFFSYFERIFGETDQSFSSRNEILFYRNGDTIWGTKHNIKGIFQKYFGTDSVYVVNNTNELEENIISNGDFEDQSVWDLDKCTYDDKAKFSGKMGVIFSHSGRCSQTVDVDHDSVFFLHFFINGSISVEIKDNNGRYWNKTTGEFGEWQEFPFAMKYSTDQWESESLFFMTDESVKNITVSFIGNSDSALLDYVRLFKKGNYPSFTVIVSVGGKYTPDTLGMAPGTSDPDKHIADYKKMSYIEQSHILGTIGVRPESVYKEILEMVRPGGISAYIEVLSKDF